MTTPDLPTPPSLHAKSERLEHMIMDRLIERFQSPDLDDKSFCMLSGIYCDLQKQSTARDRAAIAREALHLRAQQFKSKNPCPPAEQSKAGGMPHTEKELHDAIHQAVIDVYGSDFYPDYDQQQQALHKQDPHDQSRAREEAVTSQITELPNSPETSTPIPPPVASGVSPDGEKVATFICSSRRTMDPRDPRQIGRLLERIISLASRSHDPRRPDRAKDFGHAVSVHAPLTHRPQACIILPEKQCLSEPGHGLLGIRTQLDDTL